MTRAPFLPVLLLLCAGCSKPVEPPAPKPPSTDVRMREAINYVEFFKTADTQKWELAKSRLMALGPAVIPVLLEAMEAFEGEVDLNCQDVLVRMGADAVPEIDAEVARGDAGLTGEPLRRRRVFRRSLIAVLGDLPGTKAADALVRTLREDPWPTARQNAAFCLGGRREPGAIPALIEAMRRDADENVRARARAALQSRAGRDYGPDPDDWQAWHRRQTGG